MATGHSGKDFEKANTLSNMGTAEVRPLSVVEVIDREIATHVNNIHRLTELKLRAAAQGVAHLSHDFVAQLAYPSNPFV